MRCISVPSTCGTHRDLVAASDHRNEIMAFALLATQFVDGLLVAPTHATHATHRARVPCMQRQDAQGYLPPAARSLVDAVKAGDVEFETTISAIEEGYDLTEVSFDVGEQKNAAGTNMGSGKILSFGKLAGLNVEETLALFGKFYRDDVLGNPAGDDHANIRNFMKSGWEGVTFPDGLMISPKAL